jgi:hypothetical protein
MIIVTSFALASNWHGSFRELFPNVENAATLVAQLRYLSLQANDNPIWVGYLAATQPKNIRRACFPLL